MRMGVEGAQVKVAAIPTGALSLDIGDRHRRRSGAARIVEVFGPEYSGIRRR
jgi:recombination protein RecA